MLALKACAEIGAFELGQEIIGRRLHAHALRRTQVCATMISFYGSNFELELNNAPDEVVLINAMMSAYIGQNSDGSAQALELYAQHTSPLLNDISHTLALKACLAQAVHAHLEALAHDRWLRCSPLMVLLII